MTARVLVVDDVDANLRLLEARLAAEYYEVATLRESRLVLATAIEWRPDAILLDVMMPDLDGIQVCRSLKAEPRTAHVPVIMVTALCELSDRLHALAAGADEFLTKPIEHGILLARLRSVLRFKRLQDEWRARLGETEPMGLPCVARTLSRHAEVLVVDDLDARAGMVGAVLERGGATVTRVGSETDALHAAAAGCFDLIIVTLAPLAGDPLRTIARLRAADPTRDTPLLLVAEPDQRSLLIAGLDLGANDCLTLPLEENELRLRVAGHIGRKQMQDRLRDDVGNALRLAVVDPLTGLFNRRYLDGQLDVSRAGPNGGACGQPRAVLMVDVDHFKSINDRHGHAAGDRALVEVAQILRDNLRETDLIARYGGEEFIIVTSVVPEDRPEALAERLCGAVEMGTRNGLFPLTVSIGLARARAREPVKAVMARADRALYVAKQSGRNRVALADFDADGLISSSGGLVVEA